MESMHEELNELSAYAYDKIGWHQFSIETLQERLQNISNAIHKMDERWTRNDEATRSFIAAWSKMCTDVVDACFPTITSPVVEAGAPEPPPGEEMKPCSLTEEDEKYDSCKEDISNDSQLKFEIKTGIVVTNSFFLDIAEPGKWFKVEDKLHFDWDKNIASYVTGKTKGKNLKLELGRDVDMVYAPMMWGADHWYVGYTIHHVKEERRYYSWSRLVGIYHNGRTSDYGTRATKFIEMHANGDGKEEMSLITDQIVDRFREKYAMDCYEEFISDFRVTNEGSMK
ncbi:hypothetical protein F2Q69_00052896 [Brassica cretica]|uniref:Ubiquitin-like protease family profile domain-containing protein n=1 Tax=Brassica cretica TaxID=69181 RepID=A0A8S9N2L8_BRACR|nr:hypothetical protein F2Q69_00052896 [Brassica cretica]